MSSKKKPSHEARERLTEKVAEIRAKSQRLHNLIDKICVQPIASAEEVLKEKSKKTFLAKYVKTSAELEGCINQLLLVTDAITSLDNSDQESEESSDDDIDDNSDVRSVTSFTTNATSVTIECFDSQSTKCSSHESLISVFSTADSHNISDLARPTVAEVQGDIGTNENAISPKLAESCSSNGSTPVNSVVSAPIKAEEGVPVIDDPSIVSMVILKPGGPDVNVSEEKYTSSAENEDVATDYDTADENTFQMLTDVIVDGFKWEVDVPYPVVVTKTFTPMDFYIQLVNPDYSYLVNQLDVYFLKEAKTGFKGGISYVPPIDAFCCAKSSFDGFWYRAKITGIINQPKDSINFVIIEQVTVNVYFIDEGFEEIILLENIAPLSEEFTKLPAQSCKCILGGIQPVRAKEVDQVLSFTECNKMWTQESLLFFDNLVKSKDICSSYFYFPPPDAFSSTHNISKDTLVCDLYIIHPTVSKVHWWKTKTDKNCLPVKDHIGYKMICNNMAAPCPFFKCELTLEGSLEVLKEHLIVKLEENSDNSVQGASFKQDHRINDLKNDVKENTQGKVAIKQENVLLAEGSESEQSEESKGAKLEEIARILDENMNLNKVSRKQSSPVFDREEARERQNPAVGRKDFFPKKEQTSSVKCNSFFPRELKKEQNQADEKPMLSSEQNSPCNMSKSISTAKPPLQIGFSSVMFGSTFKETILPLEGDTEGFHKVLVSEVVDPGLFYVHLVTEDVVLLDKLMQELNICYSQKEVEIRSYAKREAIVFEPGSAVAAFCSNDNQWFRACVLSVRTSNRDKREYELLYVDFGSTKWMPEESVLPILCRFCDLPMVIIACCLADLEPFSNVVTKQIKGVSIRPGGFESPDGENGNAQSDHAKWPEQTTERLRSLILTQSPLMISFKNLSKNTDGLYEVHLYDTSDNRDVFINQLLVDEGLASSEVLSKVVPSVKITETELDMKVAENNAMDTWDPMREQYESKRNTYNVDTDDPGVAALGYVQPKNSICHNFNYRGYCYRGESCRYVHAKAGDPILDSVEVYCDDTILDLPKPDKCVPVVIRGLLDPTHFWVNFPYGIDWEKNEEYTSDSCGELALDKLHQSMNQHYSRNYSKKTNLSILAEGELVAAKFQEDNQWYRARVIHAADDLVQVFYVDYGNTDVIPEDNTRKLVPDFLHLPFQAVECFLFNTYLEDDVTPENELYQKMRDEFLEVVADKVLMAYVVSSSITKSLVVMLYDTTKQPHLYINELVRSWDGVIKKDANDVDSLKDRLIVSPEQKPGKVSYIPG